MDDRPLLTVTQLQTWFFTRRALVRAVNGIDFTLYPQEAIGIVGESGSGKSVTVQSVIRLVPSPPGRIVEGSVVFRGRDLLKLSEREMCRVRGREISMVFQDPMTSLNPVLTIGDQMTEAMIVHKQLTRRQARDRAVEMLAAVNVSDPELRLRQYPHQLSGGMRQRVMIASALSCEPDVLILDEPTTALDVTVQAQILRLIYAIRKRTNTAIILISHDFSVVARSCDRVLVMYAGRVVESGPIQSVLSTPRHPYTKGLLAAVPTPDAKGRPLLTIPGAPPDLVRLPKGCAFAPRCPRAEKPICWEETPTLSDGGSEHLVACWAVGGK